MSVSLGELRIANVPDAVHGTEVVETAEEQYKIKYAMQTCDFLRNAFPEQFKVAFKSYEDCVYELSAGADVAFDKWKTAYPTGLAAWAKASATRVR